MSMLIVAGIRLNRDAALALCNMLAGDGHDATARVLLAALTSGQEFVALSRDAKEDVLAALTRRTTESADLRRALFDELTWQRAGLEPPARSRGIGAVTTRKSRQHVNVAWV
jgi:hypothetical protein